MATNYVQTNDIGKTIHEIEKAGGVRNPILYKKEGILKEDLKKMVETTIVNESNVQPKKPIITNFLIEEQQKKELKKKEKEEQNKIKQKQLVEENKKRLQKETEQKSQKQPGFSKSIEVDNETDI